MALLIQLLDTLTPYGIYSYFAMFGILLLCGFGLPMPEDVVLITGGILASRGITDFWMTQFVCFAGVLVGDTIVYTLGKHFGPVIKRLPVLRRVFTPARDAKVASVFAKYGTKVIFMGRFMPGLRTPIFLTAGTYQVPLWTFLGLDGFAALISVPVWIAIGYFFGASLEDLEVFVRHFQFAFYGALLCIIVLFGVVIYLKRRLAQKSLPDPRPANR